MKAKQWIQLLTALAAPLASSAQADATPEQAEEYFARVDELANQCQAIVDERLAKLPPLRGAQASLFSSPSAFLGKEAIDRRVAAYREGLVKWDAVVHGVSQALGESAPFPLFKGGMVIKDMSRLQEALVEGSIDTPAARAHRNVFERVVHGLGYQELPVFKAMFNLIDDRLNAKAFEQVGQISDQLVELMDLVQSGQGQTPRAQALQSKVYLMRQDMVQAIKSLPPRQQMQAYFMLGERAMATPARLKP